MNDFPDGFYSGMEFLTYVPIPLTLIFWDWHGMGMRVFPYVESSRDSYCFERFV